MISKRVPGLAADNSTKRETTDHFTELCTILKHLNVNSCDCCYLYCISAGEKSLPFIVILWTKDTANIWYVTSLAGCKSLPFALLEEIQIQKNEAFSSQVFLARTYLLGKIIWRMEEHAIIWCTDNPYCSPWEFWRSMWCKILCEVKNHRHLWQQLEQILSPVYSPYSNSIRLFLPFQISFLSSDFVLSLGEG